MPELVLTCLNLSVVDDNDAMSFGGHPLVRASMTGSLIIDLHIRPHSEHTKTRSGLSGADGGPQ